MLTQKTRWTLMLVAGGLILGPGKPAAQEAATEPKNPEPTAEAIKAEASEEEPKKSEAEIALALREQGKLDEAIASYRKAIELDPDMAAAHYNLGIALGEQGKLDEAIVSLRESLRLEPRQQLSSWVQGLQEKDTQLLAILREKGAEDPSVPALVRKISAAVRFPPPPRDSVRKLWDEHGEEVLRELEQREVTTICVRKGDGARGIAEKIQDRLRKGETVAEVQGQFDRDANFGVKVWGARSGMLDVFQKPIFRTPVGEVSEIIEARGFLFVSKVHDSKPGKAHDFGDPGVKEAAESLCKEQRRSQWEKDYLEHLENRIKEEDAGKPAEVKDAE